MSPRGLWWQQQAVFWDAALHTEVKQPVAYAGIVGPLGHDFRDAANRDEATASAVTSLSLTCRPDAMFWAVRLIVIEAL